LVIIILKMSMEVEATEVKIHTRREGVTVLQASSVTIQKVRSIDEWKALNINLKSLRPAIMKGENIVVLRRPGQL
jgi:hypothetical protein